MKKLLSLVLGACLLSTAAFATDVYGPAQPNIITNLAIANAFTTNLTPVVVSPKTPPLLPNVPAAQLDSNVPYVTATFSQVAASATTANVTYTLCGSIAGQVWHPIATVVLALNGTTTVTGFTNIPASSLGGFRYLGLTAVANAAAVSESSTVRFGFWHQVP